MNSMWEAGWFGIMLSFAVLMFHKRAEALEHVARRHLAASPKENERETQQPEQTSNEKEKARETHQPEDTINEREDAYRPLCEETAPIGAEDERALGTSASGEEVVCDGRACLAVPPRAPTVSKKKRFRSVRKSASRLTGLAHILDRRAVTHCQSCDPKVAPPVASPSVAWSTPAAAAAAVVAQSVPEAAVAESPEALALAALRALLSERRLPDSDDVTLLRFIRARKWDTEAALEQWVDTVRWRAEQDVARFRRDAPDAAALPVAAFSDGVECFPGFRMASALGDEAERFWFGPLVLFGHDRLRRPIYLQKVGLGSCRFAEGWAFFGDADARRHLVDGWVWTQEVQQARMEEASKRWGVPVTKQVVIMDLKGLSYWPDARALATFREFLVVLQRYYPETLGALFFVNAPFVFSAIWRMMRGWLDPETAAKVHILGYDCAATLEQHIGPNDLLREYGGLNSFDALETRSLDETLDYFRPHLALERKPSQRAQSSAAR